MSDEPENEPPVKPAEPKKRRTFRSECYMVAVDEAWFLSKDDWTEQPNFGKKYSKPRAANSDADAERERYPGKHIRVVRAKQTITIEEIE